jgi:hypothetical protein
MRWLRRLWQRLRPPAPASPPVEICEVCGEFLAAEDVWEIRSTATDDADLEITWGGTYMSATYCAEHFPAGATRWTP